MFHCVGNSCRTINPQNGQSSILHIKMRENGWVVCVVLKEEGKEVKLKKKSGVENHGISLKPRPVYVNMQINSVLHFSPHKTHIYEHIGKMIILILYV